MMMRKCY